MIARRFEVCLVQLTDALGPAGEPAATRPCVIVSPDEMNEFIRTVLVAPLMTKGRPYPTRIPCLFEGRDGQVVLDQILTVETSRLVKGLGRLDEATRSAVLAGLAELFAP